MEWIYKSRRVTKLPDEVTEFVYIIYYEDETMYVGKKGVRTKKTLPALLNGATRPGAKRIQKTVPLTLDEIAALSSSKKFQKGKLTPYDVIYTESNWKKYEGSSKLSDLWDNWSENFPVSQKGEKENR